MTVEKIADKKTVDKKIDVLLNVGGKPAVKVDSMVWGKSKMVWVPDPDSANFIFKGLKFDKTPNPFGTPEIKNKKITIANPNFDKQEAKGQWVYTIEVEAGGKPYTTKEGGGPGDDKPVIRN